ncbi:hypothetical protein ABPG75_004118 [Micractinium tetrahymenae]
MAEGGGKAAAAAGTSGGRSGGQQIDAFTAQEILEERRVMCLEAWNQYALLGLSDGTLLLASPRPADGSAGSEAGGYDSGSEAGGRGGGSGTPAGPQSAQRGQDGQPKQGQPAQQEAQQAQQQQPQWAAVQALRGFGKGGVKQLVVARERSMLLCLADDGVNAFVLAGMRLKGQAGRTRGASMFAWHGGSDTLAVAVKRRVILFKYDGLEFVEQREASLPDAPACMALAGGTLYVGLTKRDYVAIDVGTGALSQLFTTKGTAPCMAVVSPSEVLLGRDSSAVLYGGDGRASKRGASGSSGGKGATGGRRRGGALAWSAPPAALALSAPYAVAFSEGVAEARLVEPLDSADLWQRLPLPLPAAAASLAVAPSAAPDGSLFVASRESGAVVQLRPVSFVRQAAQLLQLGEHEEALAMAALAPPEQAAERRQLEDLIHLAFGQRLFREGAYEEAMLHFGMSSLAGPLELLRLFPSLAPPKLLAAAAADQAEEEQAGGGGPGAQQGAAEAAAAGEQAASVEDGATSELQGEAFVAAVQQLMPYLLSHRSRLAAAAASPAQQREQQQEQQLEEGRRHAGPRQQTPAAAAAAIEAAQDPGPSPTTRAVLAQRRLQGSATATLLDTALLLALLALPDSGALLRFVQRPNCVDLEAGEAALRSLGRYSELVALYQTKGRHAAALELLHALSQGPEQLPAAPQGASAELRGLPGVWAAVKYVCHMPEGERDLSLISTHAKWILRADPDAGLEMFSNMQPPLPPSAALPMLTSYAPHLAGPYLEGALASGAAPPEQYEQELARIYLERLVGGTSGTSGTSGTAGGAAAAAAAAEGACGEGEGAAGEAPPESLPEYGKLRQLILGSRFLDYEALLRVMPQHRLLEVRAALLERLGRHTEALRILVHRLRSAPQAEAYCDRVYQRRQLALRERHRADLAAALRRQRQQREAAAAATAGGAPAAALYGCSSASTARSLQFEGSTAGFLATPAAGSGAAATKLQPVLSSSSSEGGADIYLLLVQVLLEEEDASGGFRPVQRAPDHAVWGEVACLLSRKRDAIPPLRALGLLPGEVALPLPFLEGALWGAGERRRSAAVARSLRRAEHVGLLGQLADAQQRSILLTPERNCSICYKRVGTAALVAFPSGLLAHYSCWRRASSGTGQQGAAGAAVNGGSAAREWR